MYQLVYPTLLLSIAFRLWQIYLPKIVRQCGQLSSSLPGSAVHLWWAMMIGQGIWVMKFNWNVKKAPLSLQKMKISFLYYVQLLMIGWAGRWTRTPFTTPLQPIKWNVHFSNMFNFWWWARLVDGLEPCLPPLSSQKKWNAHFWIMFNVQLLMMGLAGQWTRTLSTTPLQAENEMLVFGLCSTSDDQPGCLMDSNPIHHPSPAKKGKSILGLHSTSGDWLSNPSNKSQLKCDERPPKSSKNEIFIFINYVQLLMIDQVIPATKVDQNAKKDP